MAGPDLPSSSVFVVALNVPVVLSPLGIKFKELCYPGVAYLPDYIEYWILLGVQKFPIWRSWLPEARNSRKRRKKFLLIKVLSSVTNLQVS